MGGDQIKSVSAPPEAMVAAAKLRAIRWFVDQSDPEDVVRLIVGLQDAVDGLGKNNAMLAEAYRAALLEYGE